MRYIKCRIAMGQTSCNKTETDLIRINAIPAFFASASTIFATDIQYFLNINQLLRFLTVYLALNLHIDFRIGVFCAPSQVTLERFF